MNRFLASVLFTVAFSVFTKVFPFFFLSLSIPFYFSIKKRDYILLLLNFLFFLFLISKLFSVYEFVIYVGSVIVFSLSQIFPGKDFFKTFFNSIFFVIIYFFVIFFVSVIVLKIELTQIISFNFTKLLLLSFLDRTLELDNVKILVSRIYFFRDIIPAILFITIFLSAIISFYMRKKLEKIFKTKVCGIPPLSKWKVKKDFIWILIISGIIFFTGVYMRNRKFLVAGENLSVVLLFLYFLSGIGILDFHFKKSSLPVFFRYLLYILAFIFYPFPTMLGLTETWFDLRKEGTWK